MKNASRSAAQFPAVTIRVNDLYEWIRVVTSMEMTSLTKIEYNGKNILGPKWIYRGQANSEWKISSGFERSFLSKISEHIENKEQYLKNIEKLSLQNFKRWVDLTDAVEPKKEGEWLALMQHHGVPTRLIDFTEVPLIALGFALEDSFQVESDFAVWAVSKYSFNSQYSNDTIIKSIRDGNKSVELCGDLEFRVKSNEMDEQLLDKILDGTDNHIEPCILKYNPTQINKRQKLQRGLFLACSHLSENFMSQLHRWTDSSDIDFKDPEQEFYVRTVWGQDGRFIDKVANTQLIKYVFDKSLRNEAKMFLRCSNIGVRTRYGDNDTVAEETKELMLEYV